MARLRRLAGPRDPVDPGGDSSGDSQHPPTHTRQHPATLGTRHRTRRLLRLKAEGRDQWRSLRLLPTLLPSCRTTPDTRRQLWNIGAVDGHDWTALDSPPTPADQMLPAVSACPLRARSDGKPGELTVAPGEASTVPSWDGPARQVRAHDLSSWSPGGRMIALIRSARAAAPLPVLGRWRSPRAGSACHRITRVACRLLAAT